jgi:hypothetical protein
VASEGERTPELLRADREQLDRAAELLEGEAPGFVIVVCPEDLAAAARAYLGKQAEVEIPEPVVLQGAEEALGALIGERPELAAGKVRSLVLGGDVKEALRALNWNREKLLRGAPVVLWVGGVDKLTEMREAAPDAYSFRDMVVMVRGDGGRLPQVPYKESRNILEARRRVARARTPLERAQAHAALSDEFRIHGHLVEAENTARRGMETLPAQRFTEESARLARAQLWTCAAMAAQERGSEARQRRSVRQGLNELEGMTLANAQERRIWLLTVVPGPYVGRDLSCAEEAFSLAQAETSHGTAYEQAALVLASLVRELGALRRARDLLAQLAPLRHRPLHRAILEKDLALNAASAGQMHEAELYLQKSISLKRKEQAHFFVAVYLSADCWLVKGELETAERVINDSLGDVDQTDRAYKSLMLTTLAFARGETDFAQSHARRGLREAAQFALDHVHLQAARQLAWITAEACDANASDGDALQKIAAEIEVEEDVSCAITENDPPPWYPIRFLGYRAAVLIRTERHTEALDLARRALDLARTTYPDLIPETGRALADHLLRTGHPDEALPLLAEIEPEAVSRGMLKELARIRAARVLTLILRREPPSAIEPAMAALREALKSTGAPRIEAETLQDLAIRLPPDAMLPDPLALATETHTFFVEMPMPAKEARSLELAGDVLAARGKPAEARRRYLTAKGILERRGLGLRLPLLSSKIDRLA